jgi:hypothetical protein
VDNLNTIWGLLFLAGLGIGGIVVPASIITMIACPDELIATVAALTLAIRVIGGSIGYCIYYNVFVSKFEPLAIEYIGGTMVQQFNITDESVIGEVIGLTAASLIDQLQYIPQLANKPGAVEAVTYAGRLAYAAAYKYVYYVSIAFGAASIAASCFLGDIGKYMTDEVAVVM